MLGYVVAYDIRQPDAIVKCPACQKEMTIDRESIDKNDYAHVCPACGAVFGVVSNDRFRRYVAGKWHAGKLSGPAAYCDFIVRQPDPATGTIRIYRWHGWVDPDSREVVQVG